MSTAEREAPARSGRRPWRTAAVWWRVALVLVAGFVLYEASPPRDAWWLAPLAFGGLAVAVHDRRVRTGFGLGVLFGLAYLLPLLGWLQDFLGDQFGPWPWLGVALLEAVFVGLAGAGMARVSRLPASPLWMAAVFVAVELLRSAVPFGGFPWGRLAFTQISGALLPLASVGGAGAVSFAVALVGSAIGVLVWRRGGPRTVLAPLVLLAVPLLAGWALLPRLPVDADAGTARVAVVQGNAPDIGLDLLYLDDVLHDNHIRAGANLVADVEAGRVPRPDLVVLPEQIGSWGPDMTDPALDGLARQLRAPLVVGGLAGGSDRSLRNEVVHWDPQAGATDRYVKWHLVPFAERIPMRAVARLVSPFVDKFNVDMTPGTEPGVFDLGKAVVGVGLCYDVAYDDVYREATRAGATMLAVPTNNAWYGHSEMSYQQLAMSRLRAVEHGRSVVVSATSGVSAIVRPDGTVGQRTEQFTAETLSAEVPLRSSITVATRLGPWPSWIIAALGVAAVAGSLVRRRTSGGEAGRSSTG